MQIRTGGENEEGDVIDITAVLTGYDAVQDDINSFVRATEDGENTVISIDADGLENGTDFAVLVSLEGVAGFDIDQAVTNGNVAVA